MDRFVQAVCADMIHVCMTAVDHWWISIITKRRMCCRQLWVSAPKHAVWITFPASTQEWNHTLIGSLTTWKNKAKKKNYFISTIQFRFFYLFFSASPLFQLSNKLNFVRNASIAIKKHENKAKQNENSLSLIKHSISCNPTRWFEGEGRNVAVACSVVILNYMETFDRKTIAARAS